MLANVWRYVVGTLRFFLVDFGVPQLLRVLRAPAGATLEVRLPGVSHALTIRPTKPDVLVLWQTFGLRQCAVPLPKAPALIVDAGANIGCTAVFLAQAYPGARIIAVEPDRENAALARKNCAAHAGVEVVEAAVWPRPVMLEIENPNDESWAFRMKERPREAGAGGMRALTIDELSKGAPIDLLKVDIEGGERQLFSEEDAWLSRVGAMLVELHGPECTRSVAEAARRHGFKALPPQGEYVVYAR
ncbi:MAG: FkbM family methyltransferase [Myxococcaceae bacterium]|jgi:FkbM family methyltransferase|nr:FkbM family methyltransferase [Myxococcaceae bacterium]MCA3013478.1 FkbM family methyltransferase [Myxococcaceae bacterium]